MKASLKKKMIGVLGGISPESTVNFYQELINQCRVQYGATYDGDFPHIMIYNLPIPNIFREVDLRERVLETLSDGAKKLEIAGVDFIVMPCNTAHYFYDDLKMRVNVPFLSITEEAAKRIASEGYNPIGLLATGTTVQSGLYTGDCEKLGIRLVTPENQDIVTDVIDHILRGKRLVEDKACLMQVAEQLKESGAKAIVLGCTDLPLLIKQEDLDIKLFDSAKVLAESTVRYAIAT